MRVRNIGEERGMEDKDKQIGNREKNRKSRDRDHAERKSQRVGDKDRMRSAKQFKRNRQPETIAETGRAKRARGGRGKRQKDRTDRQRDKRGVGDHVPFLIAVLNI